LSNRFQHHRPFPAKAFLPKRRFEGIDPIVRPLSAAARSRVAYQALAGGGGLPLPFPAWCLGHDPSAQILSVSYAQDLSDKLARDCRSEAVP
jgi:hypothetical protein